MAKFVSSLDAQEVLARNFVSTVLKIANSSNENNSGSLDLLKVLKEELLSLEGQITDFAKSIDENAAHGSDAPETAAVEIAYFFNKDEILKRTR